MSFRCIASDGIGDYGLYLMSPLSAFSIMVSTFGITTSDSRHCFYGIGGMAHAEEITLWIVWPVAGFDLAAPSVSNSVRLDS